MVRINVRAQPQMSTNNANSTYVVIPVGPMALGAYTAITVAAWVDVAANRARAKVFDFNDSSSTFYTYLTTYALARAQHGLGRDHAKGRRGSTSVDLRRRRACRPAAAHHLAAIVLEHQLHGDALCRRRMSRE